MGDNDGTGGDKGGGKGKPKAPKLPKDAPKEVKDFLSCKEDSLELDPSKKGWLPDIPVVGAPDVKIEAGAKAGTAKVTLSKGVGDLGIKWELEISVKDGHLQVDTSKISIDKVKKAVDDWVTAYNAWLDHKNRKLDGITVKDGKATIKKAPATHTSVPGGTKVLVAGGILAVALVGVTLFTLGGDDGGSNTSNVAATTTTADQGPSATIGGGPPTDDDTQLAGVGVQITHQGSAPDAVTDEVGLSQGEVIVVTTSTDLFTLVAQCDDNEATAQAEPEDGVVRLDLALFAMVPCTYTSLTIGDTDVDPADMGLGAGFDVGPNEMLVPQADIDAALAELNGEPVEPTDPDQALRDFVGQLTTSLTTGDRAFAVDHLHPTVVGAFGPGVCAAKVEGIDDGTFAIRITAIGAPADYIYAPPSLNGTQYTVPNVITVSGNITADGQAAPGELHVADSGDGSFTWFTDCGS